MQIIKSIAIAAVLISRRAEKNNGSRKDRKHDRKN